MRNGHDKSERQRRIHALVAGNVRLGVEALAQRLDVAPMTIRRDLAEMQAAGLLLRVHGGCVLPAAFAREMSFSEKAGRNRSEKQAIARKAVTFLEANSSIYLDTGTTVAEIGRLLPAGQSLRVFTNNLRMAMDLFGRQDVEVHVYGGLLAARSPDLVGDAAAVRVSEFRTDWAIVGADAVDPETGEFYAADLDTAVLSRSAQRQAARIMVVADSSKFGRRGVAVTGRLERGVILITDRSLPSSVRRKIERRGARVITVSPSPEISVKEEHSQTS